MFSIQAGVKMGKTFRTIHLFEFAVFSNIRCMFYFQQTAFITFDISNIVVKRQMRHIDTQTLHTENCVSFFTLYNRNITLNRC